MSDQFFCIPHKTLTPRGNYVKLSSLAYWPDAVPLEFGDSTKTFC